MRGQPTPSRGRHPGRTAPSRGGAAGSGGDPLRLVRATRDQLGVAWSAEADPVSWRVVCWDSRDATVARLKLAGTHRRATFAGLARLQQPFTIAVSGLGRDRSVLWQAGLADLYLRPDDPAGRDGASDRMRTRRHPSTASQAREGAGATEAAKEGCGASQDGQDEQAEAEEEDRARQVAAAGIDRAPSPAWGAPRLSGAGSRPSDTGSLEAEVRPEGCQNPRSALSRVSDAFTNARPRRPAPRGVELARTPRAPPKPRGRADR